MAEPSAKSFKIGDITGTAYTFANAGDELPVHTHDEAQNHFTVVAAGSFRCIGNSAIEGKVLKNPAVVDWPALTPHGFIALEAGSCMVNIIRKATSG